MNANVPFGFESQGSTVAPACSPQSLRRHQKPPMKQSGGGNLLGIAFASLDPNQQHDCIPGGELKERE